MLQAYLIGSVVSEPKINGKQVSCGLEVNLEKNNKIKLITYGKKNQELLTVGANLFVVGDLSYIEDTYQLQLNANIVQAMSSDESMRPMATVTGNANYLKIEENYNRFSVGSYDGKTKKYTNCSVITNHPLSPYVNGAIVLVSGILDTNIYTNKQGDERHVLNLQGRKIDILQSKPKDEASASSNKTKATVSKSKSTNSLDGMPF